MTKRTILVQLDSDPQPSVFDGVVAVDAGAEFLFRHGGVTPEMVRDLVHGAIFTRGGDDLAATAIFISGSNAARGEELLAAVQDTFFGPMRVSVMLDPNGANTTAAAAVLAVLKHAGAADTTALVLGGTGPVGQRVARLLAREGAAVRVASRSQERAEAACQAIADVVPSATVTAHAAGDAATTKAAMQGANVVVAAGAAGVELLSADTRAVCDALRVAIDLNAVTPVGLEGVDPMDKAAQREGAICYGAIGVGGTKMKIHKAAIRRLFQTNDAVLDAEEILAIGRSL